MKTYDLLLDVGGTEIKMNGLTTEGELLLPNHHHVPAYAQASKETILTHFRSILLEWIETHQATAALRAIGLAFPGPFDYDEGISYMQGLRKYEAIYGVNLRANIQAWLAESGYEKRPIIFENDATCFALGSFYQQTTATRGIYLTIGTGCGSGFIEAGQVVKTGYGLNAMGMIYDAPFKDGIIDDYLCVDGLRKLAEVHDYPFKNGKELAQAAYLGDVIASEIYHTFGQMIGEALKPFVREFEPQEMVFGGQISQSLSLFEDGIKQVLAPYTPSLRRSEDSTSATLYGLKKIIEKQLEESKQ